MLRPSMEAALLSTNQLSTKLWLFSTYILKTRFLTPSLFTGDKDAFAQWVVFLPISLFLKLIIYKSNSLAPVLDIETYIYLYVTGASIG